MKGFFLFIVSLVLSSPLVGQVTIGLVGFPQITTLTSSSIRKDEVMDNKLSIGGGGGLIFGYGFSEKLGLQIGALYSAQNQKIKSNYTLGGVAYSHESRKRFDYIKVPVTLKYNFPLGRLGFHAYAGPQFSYLMKYDGGMIVYVPDQYFDLPVTPSNNTYYKKFVIDFTAGAGIDFPLSNSLDLTTGVKIDYSLTDAENKSATYNGIDLGEINGQSSGAARNITYAWLIGINYRFGNANDLIAPSNKFRGRSYGRKRRF